jgi:hypothetical protein
VTKGHALLKQWLESDDSRTQEWFAGEMSTRLGRTVFQATVSKWLRGATPGLEYLDAIKGLTNIPIAAWLEKANAATGTDGS